MNVQYDRGFIRKLKGLNVRVRNSFKLKIEIFRKSPFEPSLNNHPLKREYQSLRSIDITADYRAIYEEVTAGGEIFAYFITIGTHQELYG